MSSTKQLHYFQREGRCTAVALPFSLETVVRDWSKLRFRMARELPEAFSREEWAYLITFLEAGSLQAVYTHNLGSPVTAAMAQVNTLARPRGPIAIWLPNNVSLLGPLVVVLLSLTGNPIRLKGGSQSENLTGVFLEYARQHLSPGPLQTYLRDQVRLEIFEREDPRHRELAATAQMRIVFGSDAAAQAIHDLPHPIESIGFSFVDRRSEAWIEKGALNDGLLKDLLRVFAIYGQAGCTSPQRIVLLEATGAEVLGLRDRLIELWPLLFKASPSLHVASANIMARQWAAALGWDAKLTPGHGALFAAGELTLPEFTATMGLRIVGGALDQVVAALPPNIQTVGYAFSEPHMTHWLEVLADSAVRRLVPIERMHHFGPVWDGQPFWRQAFLEVEVQ